MATGYVVSGRGDLDGIFKARSSAAGADTGFKSNGGVDLAQRFEPRGAATAVANTNFKNTSAVDLAQIFQDIAYSPPFTPVTRTYTSSAGTQTETVPAGATTCVIRVWGGGGAGGARAANVGGGGGGGGYVVKTVAVSGGQTFNYLVGPGRAGPTSAGGSLNGNQSTVTTGTGPAVTLTGGGGGSGGTTTAGGAGTASGGDTNTPGVAGTVTPANGGASGGGAPGGTGDGGSGTAPGGGGAGGNIAGFGMGGNGARGQVEFAYT